MQTRIQNGAFLVWLLLLAKAGPLCPAEKPKGPDPLVQASTQAAHAQTLWEKCDYAEAEQWTKRALNTTRAWTGVNAVERDTAGNLLARIEIQIADMRAQRKRFDREAEEINQLISDGYAETARRRLIELDPPACDRRFQDLQKSIQDRLAEANTLIKEGDRHFAQGEAAVALAFYQQAQQRNRENAGLPHRIFEARRVKRSQRRVGAKIGKAVLYTVIAAGIGYTGYVGYETYRERGQATRKGLERQSR